MAHLRRLILLTLLLSPAVALAQIGTANRIISRPEPLPNCNPATSATGMPILWDTTAAVFKFCSSLNTWTTLSGGGGGGGTVSSVGLQINGASSSGIFSATGSPVVGIGTLNYNLTGNSGGIPYFSTGSILSSSNTLTANLPILGGGAGGSPISGSITGNTTRFATWNGATTSAKCVDTDASGNLQATSADCNTAQIIFQTNGANNSLQTLLNFQNVNVFNWTNPSGGNEQLNFSSQSANFFLAAPNGVAGVPSGRAIVAADIPSGTSCAANNFATGLNAALTVACAQPSFANLSGSITSSQTPLTTDGDLLSRNAGALVRVGSAGGQDFVLQGANAAPPTWLAVNNCGSATQALSYSTTTHTFGCQTITTGTGTINTAPQYSAAYYSAAGTSNTIAGVAPPTSPSVAYVLTSTPSGGAAQAPAWLIPGVPINAQTGTSYTIAATDREELVSTSNSSPVAITLPQAGSANFASNFNFALANTNTGLVTITPTTSTINGNASQIVPNHWLSYIYSDNTNYRAGTFPDIAAFPSCSSASSALQFTSATGAFGCPTNFATTTNGGALSATSPVTISAAGVIACATCVINNGTNTGTAAMTLDMSAATSAAAFRVPNLAGASSTTAGVVSYDTTNKNLHAGANGVDNILGIVPSSTTITNADCVQWTKSSNVITLADTGAACGSGNNGSGLIMDTTSAVSLSGTVYVPLSGGGLSSGTEANVDIDAPQAATISHLYVQLSSAVGVGNSVTITLRSGAASVGSPSNLACTISGASATSCNDVTDTYTASQGALLDWQITVSGTIVVTPNFMIAAQWGGSITSGMVNNCGTTGALAYYSSTGTTVSCATPLTVNGNTISYALGSNGTITSGNLACLTSSNTQGNCTALPPNNFIGVFVSSGNYASMGVVTVNIDATQNVAYGDILCASTTSAGKAHDSGGTPCTTGEWVGIVTTTATSVSSATASLRLQ